MRSLSRPQASTVENVVKAKSDSCREERERQSFSPRRPQEHSAHYNSGVVSYPGRVVGDSEVFDELADEREDEREGDLFAP